MFFFFNDTATTEIYTLSLHDALPILLDVLRLLVGSLGEGARRVDDLLRDRLESRVREALARLVGAALDAQGCVDLASRSEEHTSELQSRQYLVCRLLLEKKKK